MATKDISLEEVLNERPSLAELCEYVPISIKWYQMGIQLELNTRRLKEIEKLQIDVMDKMTKMYEVWLDTNPQATRRQIVDTLRKKAIEEMTLAHEYETKLRELYITTTTGKWRVGRTAKDIFLNHRTQKLQLVKRNLKHLQ